MRQREALGFISTSRNPEMLQRLAVDLDAEVVLECSRTGVRVTFTGDVQKYTAADD